MSEKKSIVEVTEIPSLPERKPQSHKGTFGKVFVIGGSMGMTGAAVLAAQAALKSGAGVVTCAIPRLLNPIFEVKLTSIMTAPVSDTGRGSFSRAAVDEILFLSSGYDAAIIGPGASQNPEALGVMRTLALQLEIPTVIDADALNALSADPAWLSKINVPAILTPHPGEFNRLSEVPVTEAQADRVAKASHFSKTYGLTVVLKGHKTVVAGPGKYYANSTGNPGMATAGSGDILAGMAGAFLARGLEPFEAAVLAVHAHGKAGDLAAEKLGQEGMTAEDILDNVPYALK